MSRPVHKGRPRRGEEKGDSARITFHVDSDLREWLEFWAGAKKISLAGAVRELLQRAKKSNKSGYLFRKGT